MGKITIEGATYTVARPAKSAVNIRLAANEWLIKKRHANETDAAMQARVAREVAEYRRVHLQSATQHRLEYSVLSHCVLCLLAAALGFAGSRRQKQQAQHSTALALTAAGAAL